MSIPFALPDWLPGWLPIVVLVPALLYLLVFLAIPFSVFGLRGRLDLIEARLDEIQAELRLLVVAPVKVAPDADAATRAPPARPPAMPLPASEPPRRGAAADRVFRPDFDGERNRRPGPEDTTGRDDERPAAQRRPAARPGRAEPRFDWPR